MKGMDVVKKIEQVGTGDGKPVRSVKIVDCGETSENKVQDASSKDTGNIVVILAFRCSDASISVSNCYFWSILQYFSIHVL